jgi:hypothetical protein
MLELIAATRTTVRANQAAVLQLFHNDLGTGQAQSNVPGQSGRGYRLLPSRRRNDPDGAEALHGMKTKKQRV